jgi:hypothetical protein
MNYFCLLKLGIHNCGRRGQCGVLVRKHEKRGKSPLNASLFLCFDKMTLFELKCQNKKMFDKMPPCEQQKQTGP